MTTTATAPVTAPVTAKITARDPDIRRLGQIASTWRGPIGKPLTDKRIEYYIARGFYSSPIVALRRLQQQAAALNKLPKKKRIEEKVKFSRKQFEKMFE
jgi:hypothetical protein